MAKGLVGGMNPTTTNITSSSNTTNSTLNGAVGSTPSVSATMGEQSTYSARITNSVSVPVEYVGKETDSMHINVDNATRTISGDVKWRNMIAISESEEDAYHAYPANKARINFEEINKSLTELQSDVSQLQTSCNTSASSIRKYVDDLAEIETALEECKKFCSQLRQSLDQEITTRELDHVGIRKTASENFDTLKADISKVTTDTVARLDIQDGRIQEAKTAITDETARAKSVEDKLEKSLNSTTKFALETSQSLAALQQDAAELAGRMQAVETANVVDQTVAHEKDINELRADIANIDFQLTAQYEATAEETGKLRDIQYKHESSIANITAHQRQADADIVDLQQKQNELGEDVDVLNKGLLSLHDDNADQHAQLFTGIRSEAEIRRETDVYHEEELNRLEVRISTLQTELTQVIQNLANELRGRDTEIFESLTSISYAFVDAGTAPI